MSMSKALLRSPRKKGTCYLQLAINRLVVGKVVRKCDLIAIFIACRPIYATKNIQLLPKAELTLLATHGKGY